MRITFLSGGTGTPKLLRGFRCLFDDSQLSVVVNTAEDIWISGNQMSPDIDTVTYLFAGILNTETWWGILGDTRETNEFATVLGETEFITIGDRDRAVHIARAAMLRRGMSLTEATRELCEKLGVGARILPMTDTEVTTYVNTPEGEIHFQEYWVRHRGQIPITGVERRSQVKPEATPEVIKAIRECDAVVIGPSNPVTSISPILECAGVREALSDKFVVAVSPFIGDTPVSGPAAALMNAWGLAPTSGATAELYRDFCDVFIQDVRDTGKVKGAITLDTLMTSEEKSTALAEAIVEIIRAKI